MNLLPVISRELRSQARQPFTYWLRVLGGLALTMAMVSLLQDSRVPVRSGGRVFGSLHTLMLGVIWVLVPFGTADCISRERREGTLGLLRLTPLTVWDIVIAKAAAHAFRAFTLWLAVLPVMMVVLLQGGVGWREALVSVSIHFSSLCLAIAAGVLASAYCKSWLRALTLALVLGWLLGLVASFIKAFPVVLIPNTASGEEMSSLAQMIMDSVLYVSDSNGFWSELMNLPNFTGRGWLLTEAGTTVAILLGSGLLLALAAAAVRRRWQEEPPSARAQQAERIFCTPVVGVGFFRRWLRRKLDRNPLGWLEQRSWTGRLVTWSWFAIVVSIYSAVLTDRNFFRNASEFQTVLGWLLMGSLAVSAAGSFRRERETGVLELLLVSPLTEGQIIHGRLRGLWGQFLPAVGLWLGLWIYFAGLFRAERDYVTIRYFVATFLALPMIGLYFSVCCRNFMTAVLLTFGVWILLPSLITGVFGGWGLRLLLGGAYFSYYPSLIPLNGMTAFVELGVGWFCLQYLHERLKTRRFPLERTI